MAQSVGSNVRTVRKKGMKGRDGTWKKNGRQAKGGGGIKIVFFFFVFLFFLSPPLNIPAPLSLLHPPKKGKPFFWTVHNILG